MGAVYEVIHLETERRRAMKVMLPHVLQSDDLRQRFKQEAKVAAHIDSDYIVEVFDAGVDEATEMPFLVMELLRGEELGKRLKRLGRFAPADVVGYLHQTAIAFDKTHRASIVHRDLKPENLFLTERDDGPPRIKVLDFGVAKVIAEMASTGGRRASARRFTWRRSRSTPGPASPARPISTRSPWWPSPSSWARLTGGRRRGAGNFFALANVAMRGPIEPASIRAARRGVALPTGFDGWFARITAIDPPARFHTATETVRALAEAIAIAPPARDTEPSLGDGLSMGPLPASVRLPSIESQPLSAAGPITARGGHGRPSRPAGGAPHHGAHPRPRAFEHRAGRAERHRVAGRCARAGVLCHRHQAGRQTEGDGAPPSTRRE